MQYRLIQGSDPSSSTISRFYGLNRLEKGRNGEFSDMQGLSSDRYPCMAAARTAKLITELSSPSGIKAVIAPRYDDEMTGFTGIAEVSKTQDVHPLYFYYNGKVIPYEDEKTVTGGSDMTIPAEADITLVDFNGRIIICAYDGTDSRMYYYDYTTAGSNKVQNMEKGFYKISSYTVSSDGVPKTDYAVTNTIYAASVTWSDYFKVGDAVYIAGLTKDTNNTLEIDSKFIGADRSRHISAIVEKINGHTLYLQLYNCLGERLVFDEEKKTSGGELCVYINIPTMNHICIHNNRLWGTNPNGEYVYASKLGDPFNWNTFQGLSNDSYYAEVGTAGGFVGIVSYRDNLVAFKRDYIHHIYGDKPANFSMPKQLSDCGCIDIRSAVQIGTSLYFLGYNGFYEYLGGQPELISAKLDRKYTKAVAATDGQKYIVSCTDTDGKDELLVYDTRYGMWHREKSIESVVGSFRRKDKLYIASQDAVYEYSGGAVGEWDCTGVIINEGSFDNKSITALWIRAKLGESSSMKVYTREDGGEWIENYKTSTAGLHRHYVPVRFIDGDYYEFRITGQGEAVILDIEREVTSGGRDNRSGE